jgi:exosortase A-associated hydrolase 2
MQRIVLWGVRLGALLAAELSQHLDEGLERVVLWQPVVSGRHFVRQFLRLRAAADMMGGHAGLNTRDLHAELERGRSVEVAGYDLHPELALRIEQMDLRKLGFAGCAVVDWIELVPDHGQSLSPLATQVIEGWRAMGIEVCQRTVIGDPYWAAAEITIVPALLEASDFNTVVAQE